jgi:outer membrane protein insertion porin family
MFKFLTMWILSLVAWDSVFAQLAPQPQPRLRTRAANGPLVQEIRVRGNAKVESDAIVTLLKTRKSVPFSSDLIKQDIKTLYELGYFSDIRIYKEPVAGGIRLMIEVKEKPAIVSIAFKGNDEITEDTLKEKLETKLYTIVNEATITTDVRMIEKQYSEKGFYLVKATYTLTPKSPTEVELTFHVDEGGKVLVGQVDILGNKFFTDTQILNDYMGFASRPYTRGSAYGGSSLFQADLLKRDGEYLGFLYRDHGFAEVKVSKPMQFLDEDRSFARLTFQVEEGLQFDVGSIDVKGDLLFTKEELLEAMKLKPGELFRYSRFTRDIEMLVDKYGDLGYAYVDVDPQVINDRDKRVVHITYNITKGEKVYFGTMTIIGNSKTRDNVIRREFEVADSELYHGTGLTNTKNNINRLGYFEEVQVLKERDLNQQNLLNLKIKVKEKPTGQLSASFGYSPGSPDRGGSSFTVQSRYEEKNQSGKGWTSNLQLKWNGEEDYDLDLGFTNPRLNDSDWAAGTSLFLRQVQKRIILGEDEMIKERRFGGSVFIGRKLIELIRGRITYKLQKISTDAGDVYLFDFLKEDGIASSMIFSLLRTDVDNYIDPTEGSEVVLSQNVTGGPLLRGDQQFFESSAEATYYYPIDISDTYRTYFKIRGHVSYIYPFGDQAVPFAERYRLGSDYDLRAYRKNPIGPRYSVMRVPGGRASYPIRGGDKKMYYSLEYFAPLIPEANIKALVFGDIGRVYDDNEPISFDGFYRDVGFGFRWITPIAPFRFEWAYPLEDGRLGDPELVFNIGY